MVQWKDPDVLYHSTRAVSLIIHVFFGIYLWEFATNLRYDYALLSGRRKRTIAAALYILARYTALVALALGVVSVNAVSATFNCTPLYYILYAAGFSSVAFASGLLYLRVCAISSNSKPVIVGFGFAYLAYWGVTIMTVVEAKAYHVPTLFICAPASLASHIINTFYMLGFDVGCLAIMLWCLLRMPATSGASLWQLLVQQGFVHISLISTVYLLGAIVQQMKLNDAITHLPEWCCLLIMVICATRMQRSLEDFANNGNVRNMTPSGSSSFASPHLRSATRYQGSQPHVQIAVDRDVVVAHTIKRQPTDEEYGMEKLGGRYGDAL